MKDEETGGFAWGVVRNGTLKLEDDVRSMLDDRINVSRRALEAERSFGERLRPTPEMRALKTRIRSSMLDKLGVRDDVEKLHELTAAHMHAFDTPIRPAATFTQPPPEFLFPKSPPLVTNIGELWWAQTFWSHDVGNSSIWWEDDGMHIAARYDSNSGDLQMHWIRVTAQFVLDGARMPPGGRRYVSNPVSVVAGQVFGWGGGIPPLLDYGDQWAKCWLNTKQTVYVLEPPPPPPPPPPPGGVITVLLAQGISAAQSMNLVFLENSSWLQKTSLPGALAMPAVSFVLPANALSVSVHLEWEFHVQVEGPGTFVLIGHLETSPSCLLQHFQWQIREF